MSQPKQLTSLLEVTGRVFEEFSMYDDPTDSKIFKDSDGDTRVVRKNISKEPVGKNIFTLIHMMEEGADPRKRVAALSIYSYDVEMELFNPYNEWGEGYPLFTLAFYYESPLQRPQDRPWLEGRGWWVPEFIIPKYGNDSPSSGINIASAHNTPSSFGFLLKVQTLAYELAQEIPNCGHWEYEWDPARDYSTRPVGKA